MTDTAVSDSEAAVRATLEDIYQRGRADGRKQGYAEGVAAAQAHLETVPELTASGSRSVRIAPDTSIESLDFSVRVYSSLHREGIATIGDLSNLTAAQVSAFRLIGAEKGIVEIRETLKLRGYTLSGE